MTQKELNALQADMREKIKIVNKATRAYEKALAEKKEAERIVGEAADLYFETAKAFYKL